MTLTKRDKEILTFALIKIDEHYHEREKTCRAFKWIANKHLSNEGKGYFDNIAEVEEKTLVQLKKDRLEAREVLTRIIKNCWD